MIELSRLSCIVSGRAVQYAGDRNNGVQLAVGRVQPTRRVGLGSLAICTPEAAQFSWLGRLAVSDPAGKL